MAINAVLAAAGTADVEAMVAAHATLRLCGLSVAETAATAAAAEIIMLHGATQAAGVIVVAPINVGADGFGVFWFENGGIPCPNGITLDRVSGTTTVVAYVDRV